MSVRLLKNDSFASAGGLAYAVRAKANVSFVRWGKFKTQKGRQ